MNFACPKCSTRYTISDDKVPPAKVLRFPCKKCGNVIRLRRKAPGKTAPAPSHLSKDAEDDRTLVAPPAELAKLRSQAAQALSGEQLRISTKVASTAEIHRALAADDSNAGDEWYVLVAGKQKGPMPTSQVLTMVTRHEIDIRTYVWRDGMADWQRLSQVQELVRLATLSGNVALAPMASLDQPVANNADNESTVAMDARQLREHLRRSRGKPSAAETEVIPRQDQTQRAATESVVPKGEDRVAMSGPEVIDALAGVPTGERLVRKSDASTGTGAGQPAIEATEFASLANSESNLFAEDSTDFALPVGGGLDEIREVFQKPVESSIDGLGPTFSEALSGSEEERHLSASDGNASYLNAPPGESTQMFMATAGLYRRRRTHRVAATAGILLSLLLVGIVSLDIIGLIEIPGMGLVYRTTGLVDPNAQRGIRSVERELAESDLPAERREELKELREKLLGTTRSVPKRRPAAGLGKRAIIQKGVKDPEQMSHEQRQLTESVFHDEQKKENRIHLANPEKIQAPNLPDGLDKETIANVVGSNSSSMNLCLTESMRKGERLGGRMDIEVTIAPDGRVLDVNIASNQFRSTEMGRCTVRRIKSWRFPRFNGEPVTVIYPYILQSPI